MRGAAWPGRGGLPAGVRNGRLAGKQRGMAALSGAPRNRNPGPAAMEALCKLEGEGAAEGGGVAAPCALTAPAGARTCALVAASASCSRWWRSALARFRSEIC